MEHWRHIQSVIAMGCAKRATTQGPCSMSLRAINKYSISNMSSPHTWWGNRPSLWDSQNPIDNSCNSGRSEVETITAPPCPCHLRKMLQSRWIIGIAKFAANKQWKVTTTYSIRVKLSSFDFLKWLSSLRNLSFPHKNVSDIKRCDVLSWV